MGLITTRFEHAGGGTSPGPRRRGADLRVLVLTENASARYGGEAVLPLHVFRALRRRGVEAWMIVHERTRGELSETFPDDLDRLRFVPETRLDRLIHRVSPALPKRVHDLTFAYAGHLRTMSAACRMARRLVADLRIDVVHCPTPVAPNFPSVVRRLGAPVVMGPMNGGMTFPPAYRSREGRGSSAVNGLGRAAAPLLHAVLPGRLEASTLLVANDRTRRGLPAGVRGEVSTLVENGVDLSLWAAGGPEEPRQAGPTRFLYVGWLVELKGVDLLIEAFARTAASSPSMLEFVGEGPLRGPLEARARDLGVSDRVTFRGWLPQAECARRLRASDCLVLPSLRECGGAVVLEAMASRRPVIATRWGGPVDYVDDACGILVDPGPPESFVAGLAGAMTRLAESPDLRRAMGRAGRARVEREFDWARKVEAILECYERTVARAAAGPGGTRRG